MPPGPGLGAAPPGNLGDTLFRAAPGRVAIADLGGEAPPRSFTYAEVDRLCAAAARALLARGLARGSRVAILSANRAEFLTAALGAMRAGLVAVPVNHRLPPPMQAQILMDCGAAVVVADARRRAALPPGLEVIPIEAFAALSGGQASVAVALEAAALFLYTSGSTGQPKGVVLSHGSQCWVLGARAQATGLGRQRVLVAAPLYHMNGLALAQLTLFTGGMLILLPGFTARSYLHAAATYRATLLTAVPAMMAAIVQHPALLQGASLGSVTAVRMGSAPVSAALAVQVREAFPGAHILNAYGVTEAGPVVFAPHPAGRPAPEGSLGRAHPEVALRLVRDGAVVPDGGVLQINSPGLMTRYHNQPAATSRAFTPDGYYHTGDVFACDGAGFYRFIGREDDMFVSLGENIYPGPLEAALEAHPAVLQACVVPVPHRVRGAAPFAFVVLRPGAEATQAALLAHMRRTAPAYARPRRIRILPELPLGTTGKVDRAALRRMAESPA